MADFTLASYLAAGLTSFLLVSLVARRHSLVKPSFFCLLFYNIQLQWSSAIRAGSIYDSLSHPWDYFLMVQLFPLAGVLITPFFFNAPARRILARIQEDSFLWGHEQTPLLTALTGSVALILLWYFAELDISQTGLLVLLSQADNATMARENSLKLLPNAWLRYAVSILNSSLIPLLAVLYLGRARWSYFSGRRLSLVFSIAALLFLLMVISLSGARAPAAMLILTLLVAITLQRKTLPSPMRIGVGLGAVLLIPALLSMIRDLGGLSWDGLWTNYANVLDRSFGRVIEDGLWHMEYVQKRGFFGVAGIGNLATLFGYEPVNTFNIVGLEFVPNFFSVSANTCFSIAYYDCFGLSAFPLCLGLLCVLDGLMHAWERLKPPVLLACVAASLVGSVSLVSTFFTTAFLTFGLAVIPTIGAIIQFLFPLRSAGMRAVGAEA